MRNLLLLVVLSFGMSCIKPAPLPPNIVLQAIDENGYPIVGASIATGTIFAENSLTTGFEIYQEGFTDEAGKFLAYRSEVPSSIIIDKDGFCDFADYPLYEYDRNAIAIDILYKRKSVIKVSLDPLSNLGPNETILLTSYPGSYTGNDFVFSSINDLFETEVCHVDQSGKFTYKLIESGIVLSRNSTTYHIPAGDTIEVFLTF